LDIVGVFSVSLVLEDGLGDIIHLIDADGFL
jgi:hypothetical protein